jgi:serine/threonine protein kinase
MGSGKYASVYKVRRIEDRREFALKRVAMDQMNKKSKANSINEAKILQKIRHPNIVGLEEYCLDDSNGHLWYFCPYSASFCS